jgi:Uncharacterized conserved protein (DUF2190)
MAGFVFKYMLGGGVVYLTSFTVKTGETITKGMMCKITSGEAEPADTSDTTAFGVAANDAAAGETVKLYPPDSVYAAVDSSARSSGDCLDIAAGSAGITSKTNDDLICVRNSAASDDSLVTLHGNAKIFANAT